MGVQRQSRRERLRAATTAQIKATALSHLASEGSNAVSLRAIAREMGMTAAAIYGYFDTREALVEELIADLHEALAERLDKACRDVAADDPAAAILALGHAYRHWAISNPQYFHLIHGRSADERHPVPEAAHRGPRLLAWLVAARIGDGDAGLDPGFPSAHHAYDWADFAPEYVTRVRAVHAEVSPAAVALALRWWARMHGLVSLEVYGHLGSQTREPEKLFNAEIQQFAAALGGAPGARERE
ncbi:TetR/AcrR family transcriptional regulator [Streptomyces sp. NPDC088341]|uniref:TetR/AcrR family transcriptional regulator n=1 Tax=Streptomyces sp. NPDC088341 TaxID=3154870 RepID=UPI00342527B9